MAIAALYLFDEPFWDRSSGIDRRGTRAVSVLLGAFPVIILHGLLAGGRDVGGVYDEALVDRQRVLAFDNEFGQWGKSFVASNAPTPANFCQQGW